MGRYTLGTVGILCLVVKAAPDAQNTSFSRFSKPTQESQGPSPLELVLPSPFNRLKLKLGQLHVGGIILQPTIHFIPRLHRPNTGRRPCQDYITCLEERERLTMRLGREYIHMSTCDEETCLETHNRGHMLNQCWNLEHHIRGRSVLLHLVVHLQKETQSQGQRQAENRTREAEAKKVDIDRCAQGKQRK